MFFLCSERLVPIHPVCEPSAHRSLKSLEVPTSHLPLIATHYNSSKALEIHKVHTYVQRQTVSHHHTKILLPIHPPCWLPSSSLLPLPSSIINTTTSTKHTANPPFAHKSALYQLLKSLYLTYHQVKSTRKSLIRRKTQFQSPCALLLRLT